MEIVSLSLTSTLATVCIVSCPLVYKRPMGSGFCLLVLGWLNFGSICCSMIVAIFASFSGAAVFGKRCEFLFLGGILSSAISTLLMLQFGSYIFGGASAIFNLELYGGLLLFVGYVLFDTQVITERANKGDDDYLKNLLDLFMDFVSIFVRILIILTKNSGERNRKDGRKEKSCA